jgi:hypothetical protein
MRNIKCECTKNDEREKRSKKISTYLMPGLMSPRIASLRLAVRYGSYMMASRRDLDVFRYF